MTLPHINDLNKAVFKNPVPGGELKENLFHSAMVPTPKHSIKTKSKGADPPPAGTGGYTEWTF